MEDGSPTYQATPGRLAYALLEPLKEELWWLKWQQIIIPLGMDDTSEWCNNFMPVPSFVHRGPTINDILPRLACVKYLTLIDASSGYNNSKLGEKSSYLTTFSCPFGKYQYIIQQFGEPQEKICSGRKWSSF